MERMNPMNGTSIVILNYNTRDFLDTCLQSIRANTRDVPHEVIVVDNGSKDGSVKWLKQQKDIRCIFNKKNEGFPKGCNQGLAIARGTELLLLNSDTIVTPRWLSNMRTALYSRDNVGAVGCMTNYCSNFQQVNDAGYKSVDELMTFAEKYNRSDPAKWERRLRLVGFCFLFRRDIYEKLGGLDEQFSPGNYEDDDYSLRIWQAGYELLLCRDTFIHHFGSGSFVEDETAEVREKKRQAYHALLKRNGEKFIEKWNVPYNYKELGLRDIFPDWQGPEVVRCIDLQADFLRRQKALEKKMAHAGELQRPVHDLPVLYFSSDRKDVEPHDLEMVNFCDHDAGPVAFETGIEGLRLDFRAGVRLRVPKGPWHVRIGDAETGLWFFDGDVSGTVLVSMEKYAIRWQIEVYRDGEFVFSHTFDPTGLNVFFDLSETPLGTSLMFLPYIEAYQRETGCHAVCRVKEQMKPILWRYCSDLALADAIGADDYAVYYIEAFQSEPFFCPDDCRKLTWQEIGRSILHVHGNPPMLACKQSEVPELGPVPADVAPAGPGAGRYVCIAVQTSGVQKCWLHPGGWDAVVAALKADGYRVLCIDRNRAMASDGYCVSIPSGAEDFTGARPLQERIDLLAGAACFIGGPSGLSWVARIAGCPVVLISGLTLPQAEFSTPYRVYNSTVCHGCYNDMRVNWQESICPYHAGTSRELECSKKITPLAVLLAVQRALADRVEKTKRG
ncbi:MAG: autotransporter strand-loop-strand O-heptosyltransferase [Selenomonas sp.]|nr:autotransporter strand-loop-strand O-heptosyltransferase [Veillonellaceae bacterium]